MRRSVGVTLSAVLLFVWSAVPLFFGMLAALAFLAPPLIPFPGMAIFRALVVAMSLIALGLASWGIASGVGLMKLQRWARTSTLVLGSLMIYLSLPPAFVLPFWRIREIGAAPVHFGESGRVAVAAFYAAFATLGIFWLFFFNRQSIKAQFKPAAAN